MKRRLAPILVLTALAIGLPSAPARAGDAYRARFFDEQAREAFAHRHYRQAFEAFSRVYAEIPAPATLYNMALAADLAGEQELAFAHFTAYLAEGGESEAHVRDARRRLGSLTHRLALVRVVTTPPGAQIYLDRRERGSLGVTPRVVVAGPGTHRLYLEAPGYEPVEREVEASVGGTAEVELALAPRTGTLRVTSATATAEVIALRGEREIARGSVGQELSLPVGSYRVRGVAPGHRSVERVAAVREGRTTTVEVELPALPVPTGRLLVSTGEVRARLYVDGEPRAETPVTLPSLRAGLHRVELRAEGYASWTGQVEVRSDRPAYLDVSLVESP